MTNRWMHIQTYDPAPGCEDCMRIDTNQPSGPSTWPPWFVEGTPIRCLDGVDGKWQKAG